MTTKIEEPICGWSDLFYRWMESIEFDRHRMDQYIFSTKIDKVPNDFGLVDPLFMRGF